MSPDISEMKDYKRKLKNRYIKGGVKMIRLKKVAIWLLVVLLIFSLTSCGKTDTVSDADKASDGEQKEEKRFPTGQINMIIQAAPGGLSDTVARAVATEMEKDLGVPVICTNKTGAAGAVAMAFLQGSNPDGYTLGYVPVELSMVKALGFASDVEPDKFDLLGRSNISPATVTVQASAPWNTLEEFVDYAKNNPGKIKVGNSGTGSIWHIAAVAFEKAAEIKFNHVPFDGAAPATAALLGGHLDAITVSVSEVKAGVENGQLKVLGVMDEAKSPYLPEVVTLKEKGFDVVVAAWGGFAAPKGLSEDVKDVIYPAVEKAVNSESLKKIAEERGFTVAYLPPDDFAAFANSQFEFYMKLIPEMEIKK